MDYSYHRETVNDWLADATDEEEPPVLDNRGRCLVMVGEQVVLAICVPEASDRVYLYADVLALPEERSARFYEQLLEYNAMPEVARGLVLAFDRDARSIVASYSTEIAGIDTVDFRNILGNISNAVLSLRVRLGAVQHEHIDKQDRPTLLIRA
jgi:Tir chaperone protein (CesT) family